MEIRAELEDVSAVKKKLTVEIPVEVSDREFRRVTDEYKNHARIPGFRAGKAPLPLIKRRFAEDIRDEVVRKLVPDSYEQAVKEKGVRPLGRPMLENLRAEEGKPVFFEAHFEVLPEFELPSYRGLKIEVEDSPVGEAQVQEQLQKLREQNAEYMPVEDRPSQEGDHVTIDLKGSYLDVEQGPDPGPVSEENVIVQLGDAGTHQAFTANLQGLNIGEEKTFVAEYPDDYAEKKLAGHRLEFTAQVTDIKRKVLPELNDDFAKDLGSFESLREIEDRIRQDLEQGHKSRLETETVKALKDRLVELTRLDVPEVLVNNRVEDRLEGLARRIASQGIDPSRSNINWRNLRDEVRPEAEKDIKSQLILDRIASEEAIEVPQAEIEEELARTAAALKQPVEKVRQYFAEESESLGLKADLRRRKALAIIRESATINLKKK